MLPVMNEKEDPRVTRTRNLILQSFSGILNEKGFHSLTVQDVAQKAGINRATFYAHFPDKYALLDHSIRQMFIQEIEKRTLNACHYSDENLRALIIMVCEFVSNANSHCTPAQTQFESLVETQVKNQMQELLEMWLKKEQTVNDPGAAATAATAASWAIYGLVLKWSRDKRKTKLSPEEFADQVFPLVVANLKMVQPA